MSKCINTVKLSLSLCCLLSLAACSMMPWHRTMPAKYTHHDPTSHSSLTPHKLQGKEASLKHTRTKSTISSLNIPANLENDLARFNGVKIIHRGEIVDIVICADKIFAPNEQIVRKESLPLLFQLTSVIKAYHPDPVFVTVYSDDVGSKKHNIELTTRQAQTIVGYFWAHEISEATVRPFGYGEEPTVASNETSLGSAMNRRIEILFWNRKPPPRMT